MGRRLADLCAAMKSCAAMRTTWATVAQWKRAAGLLRASLSWRLSAAVGADHGCRSL